MIPDELLRDVARVAREDAAREGDDPRWERLARGELTAAEEAEIRRQAAESPEIAALYEAFRPLSDVAKSNIARRIAVEGEEARRVVPIRPWRRAALVVLPLAAAAAVALWAARPARDGSAVASLEAPIPDYALAVTGGDRATRSTAAPAPGPLDLRRDSRLELVLRPSKPVAGPVTARGFLVQGTDARPWSPPLEVSSDGAIRVVGQAGDLLGVPAGTWDVSLVVGRADALPTDPNVVARAMRGSERPPWQLLTTRVRLVDGP